MNAKTPRPQEEERTSDEETMKFVFPGVLATWRSILFSLIFAANISAAAGQTTPDSAQKGTYDISFDQRSPLSALSVQVQRYGVERSKAQIYETANEKLFVVV